eukprot:1142519-Pelagomonas_calceolata.AAC.3
MHAAFLWLAQFLFFCFGASSSLATGSFLFCFGSPAARLQDANTYASWGVDYLKYDFCYMENSQEPVEGCVQEEHLYASDLCANLIVRVVALLPTFFPVILDGNCHPSTVNFTTLVLLHLFSSLMVGFGP